MEAQDAFAALGAQLIGVAVDLPEVARAYARQAGARFPLIGGGPDHAIARAYAVLSERYTIYRRETFVIDGAAVIRHVIRDPHDMLRHCLDAPAAVRSLVSGTPAPAG